MSESQAPSADTPESPSTPSSTSAETASVRGELKLPSWSRKAVFGLYGVALLLSAWIQDDAYITFRTIDNFLNGFGLTWNVGERVQVYSHPLWMFLQTGVIALFGDAYMSSLILSLVLSCLVFYGLTVVMAVSPASGFLAGALLLTSKSFIDFSTSGLENPLSHGLIVFYAWLLIQPSSGLGILKRLPENRREAGKSFLLALTVCAAMLNRLDTVLIYFPSLVLRLWVRRREGKKFFGHLVAMSMGFKLLVVWHLFSLMYYGFLVPNPANAKLTFGIGAIGRWTQGFFYWTYTALLDPMTC